MSTLTQTHWASTLHLNGVRIASATVTLVVLYLLGLLIGLVGHDSAQGMSLLNVVLLPAALLIVGSAILLIFRLAGGLGVPYMDGCAGLMALVMTVFIAVGDPLIWVLRKFYPAIVPVEKFSFINPHAVVMVQKQ